MIVSKLFFLFQHRYSTLEKASEFPVGRDGPGICRVRVMSGCAPMISEHPGVSIVIMKVDYGESARSPNSLIRAHSVPLLVPAQPIERPAPLNARYHVQRQPSHVATTM